MIKKQFLQFIHRQFRNNEIALHELNYLFWETTLRCNLHCLHCGSDCRATSGVKDMPFEDFINALFPLPENYKPENIMVVITGGEPLLRSDLEDCGFKLRKKGFRWGIVTNGYAYTKERHQRLLAAGMGAVTLSLDGLEKNHNWLRNNPNSFRKALEALDLIVSAPQLNYDVVTCVHSQNIGELEEVKKLLIHHKTKAWRLFTIAPVGRATDNEMLRLNSSQLRELMDFIVQSRQEGLIDVKFSCEAYTGEYEELVRDAYFFCRAGINIGSILIDGSISACPNIDRSFVQGSIYRDKFWDIWQNSFLEMRERKWMKKGTCQNCRDFKNCNGGAMHLWDSEKNSIRQCHNLILKGL